jgi:hypothetical protein
MPRLAPSRSVSATAFAISLFANVFLVFALVAVVTFMVSHASSFLPGGGAGQSTPAVTATPSPSPSAAASGWLQLTPSSVQMGCGDSQQTQLVILQNTGAASVRWLATFSLPGDQAGVVMSPQHGTLAAGASVQIQLQNTTQASDTRGAAGVQGVITFTPRSSDAGPPATLTYATVGC